MLLCFRQKDVDDDDEDNNNHYSTTTAAAATTATATNMPRTKTKLNMQKILTYE